MRLHKHLPSNYEVILVVYLLAELSRIIRVLPREVGISLLCRSQGKQTKTHTARNTSNELADDTKAFLRKNFILRIQPSPVHGTFPVAVKLVQVAVLVRLDETDIVKADLVLRVAWNFRVPL